MLTATATKPRIDSTESATTFDTQTVALTCGACDSHNVSDKTGLGVCGDCGLTDNLSAFTGGGITSKGRFQPSQYAKGGGSARSFDAPRGWTISGSVD